MGHRPRRNRRQRPLRPNTQHTHLRTIEGTMSTTHYLYDLTTNDPLGEATVDQVKASDAAGVTGAFMIDQRTGEVLTPGTWDAQEAARNKATRLVYTH